MRQLALLFVCFVAGISSGTAEVYLSKEAALDLVLGKDCERTAEPRLLDAALKEELQERKLWGEEADTAYFFSCRKAGAITGYAIIDNEIGKHLPITYIVGISPAGKVTQVEIMVFREVRGWEVREKKFTSQFESKQLTDPMRVGRDIGNMSGATLSSISIAKGVKRDLYLWQHFYGTKQS